MMMYDVSQDAFPITILEKRAENLLSQNMLFLYNMHLNSCIKSILK